jgi:hypothetical protein
MAKSDRRDRLIKQFVSNTDPFGKIGNLSPGQRIKRGRSGKITEDDPRWNGRTMGDKRYRDKGFVRQG